MKKLVFIIIPFWAFGQASVTVKNTANVINSVTGTAGRLSVTGGI